MYRNRFVDRLVVAMITGCEGASDLMIAIVAFLWKSTRINYVRIFYYHGMLFGWQSRKRKTITTWIPGRIWCKTPRLFSQKLCLPKHDCQPNSIPCKKNSSVKPSSEMNKKKISRKIKILVQFATTFGCNESFLVLFPCNVVLDR